jgi:hypothetical protein
MPDNSTPPRKPAGSRPPAATSTAAAPAPAAASPGIEQEAIQEAVRSIRYGVVQLIIQDGRVVQIDKTEKIRLT